MSEFYHERSDNGSTDGSRDLELVIDIFDDGRIELVSNEDRDESEITSKSEPPLEQIYASDDGSSSEQNFLQVSDGNESDSSDFEPELLQSCPPKCWCPGNCHAFDCDDPDDVVMMEANILVKVPIRRKCFDRLIEIVQIYQNSLK
ncbi:uncharacterized protein LOC131432463 [Malaya genurostris]|uniref:uncharacterized protein LOC131432463 n=1 Tax=Malaya genurostris TaxID=325434 RepID=UPI0026F385F3|nr:uncharacterized protein LOC131432463 [Malaya genurostris]